LTIFSYSETSIEPIVNIALGITALLNKKGSIRSIRRFVKLLFHSLHYPFITTMPKRKVEFVAVGNKRRLFCESLLSATEQEDFIKFAQPLLGETDAGCELKIRECYRTLYSLIENIRERKEVGGCVVTVRFGTSVCASLFDGK
jgi:hypothetical protein